MQTQRQKDPMKKANARRFASLTALGTATLALNMGQAEATIIYSGPLNEMVGFSPGYGSSSLSPAIGPLNLQVKLNRTQFIVGSASFPPFPILHRVSLFLLESGALGGNFRVFFPGIIGSTAFIAPVGKGVTWSAAGTRTGSSAPGFGAVGNRGTFIPCGSCGKSTHLGASNAFNDKFGLFRFNTGSGTDYGWVELTDSVTLTTGPDVTLLGFAYDDSGARIAAGALPSSVPEPTSRDLALTGLAALVLGGAFIRRWRARRSAVTSA